jgi:hypothetical protein
MKLLAVTDMEVAHPNRPLTLLIPGGWNAYVGQVTLDKRTQDVYANYLGNAAKAAEIGQKVFEAGYLAGLRHAIKRRAIEYAMMFPDLVEEKKDKGSKKYATLRGFDPELVQSCYVPHDNVGRTGKAFAENMLRRMGIDALKGKRELL